MGVGPSDKSVKITVTKKGSADAGVVVDAGTPDAGAKFDPTERRDELKVLTLVLANEIGSRSDQPTNVKKIMFASVFDGERDSAIVVFEIGGTETANFFFWKDGKWRVFPSDFE